MLFRAALFFENVTNVIIDNVEVSDSIGMGVAMYDVTGKVCTYPGGGRLSVEFTYCKPGVNMCGNGTVNKNASYSFVGCTFKDNTAMLVDDTKYITVAFGIGTPQFG